MKAGANEPPSRCIKDLKYCILSGSTFANMLQGAKAHHELQANVLALAFLLLALHTWRR